MRVPDLFDPSVAPTQDDPRLSDRLLWCLLNLTPLNQINTQSGVRALLREFQEKQTAPESLFEHFVTSRTS